MITILIKEVDNLGRKKFRTVRLSSKKLKRALSPTMENGQVQICGGEWETATDAEGVAEGNILRLNKLIANKQQGE